MTVAGFCPDFEKFEKIIEDHTNLELLIESIPSEKVSELFNSSDFSIFPYRAVTQSGPLIMSYNYRTIPIASDLPGFREYIVDAKTGFLFDNENHISLAKKMEKALNLSETQRKSLIENKNKFRDREFNIDSIVDKYDNFFKELVK